MLLLETTVDADHGHLDNVGLTALDRGVDGVTLSEATDSTILTVDIGEITAAVEERLDVSLLAGDLLGLFHIFLDFREGLEIALDELARLSVGDLHALCKTIGGDAIDDTEIGLFGFLTFGGRDLLHLLMPDLCGCCGMDIEALAEHLNHILIATEMGHDSQFDLTVVGTEEETAGLGDETFADLLAVIGADGDVLQVGIRRREAAGGCEGLVEGSMYVPRTLVDKGGEVIDIRREEFLHAAVVKDILYDRVLRFQTLQDFL